MQSRNTKYATTNPGFCRVSWYPLILNPLKCQETTSLNRSLRRPLAWVKYDYLSTFSIVCTWCVWRVRTSCWTLDWMAPGTQLLLRLFFANRFLSVTFVRWHGGLPSCGAETLLWFYQSGSIGSLGRIFSGMIGMDCLDAAMQFQVTGQHWNTNQVIPCRTIWREQGIIARSKCCLFTWVSCPSVPCCFVPNGCGSFYGLVSILQEAASFCEVAKMKAERGSRSPAKSCEISYLFDIFRTQSSSKLPALLQLQARSRTDSPKDCGNALDVVIWPRLTARCKVAGYPKNRWNFAVSGGFEPLPRSFGLKLKHKQPKFQW